MIKRKECCWVFNFFRQIKYSLTFISLQNNKTVEWYAPPFL
nr:MAG TPA: hypothetical protein [Caudoviricetes sp.]